MKTIGNFLYEYRFVLTIIFIIMSLAYILYKMWSAPLINCEEDDLGFENQIEENETNN